MDRSCGLRSKEKFEVIPLVFLGFCFLYLQHGYNLNEYLEGGDWKVVILFKQKLKAVFGSVYLYYIVGLIVLGCSSNLDEDLEGTLKVVTLRVKQKVRLVSFLQFTGVINLS